MRKIYTIGCLVLVIILILILFITFYKKEAFDNISEIPFDIYTTWHTKNIPPKMKECVDKIKRENPEFTYNLYDEEECRQFILENFENDILKAFDSLIPLSYKSDLWRYCILYKNGGVYLDIKFFPENGFKFKDIIHKDYFVKDLESTPGPGVCNGMIVSKPNNPKLKRCIDKIVENVNNKYYGNSPLDPTGPTLLGLQFTDDERSKLEYELKTNDSFPPDLFIVKRKNGIDTAIVASYPEYRLEQAAYGKLKHYSDMWRERNIYV